MKRLVCLAITLVMLFSITSFAFAAAVHDQHRKPGNNDQTPLRWGEDRRSFEGHHMEAIHDKNIERHYPGLHGYRWRGQGDSHSGFWHNGHYVNDGIAFFNDDDQMAGFGYMAEGTFVFVDENGYHVDRDALMILLLMKLLRSF